MSLGERIARLRKAKGLSQDELADLLGISRGAVSMYEINKREPDYGTLQSLADFFGVSIDYLLGRTDDPTPPSATHDDTVETEAAHRTDDPMADLPEEARRSLREFQEYILNKYGKKTE